MNIFVKFHENFVLTKLLISFDRFDNFETGPVSYFAKLKTTKLSALCRALIYNETPVYFNGPKYTELKV